MLNVFIYVYINFFMLCHLILGCQVVSPVAVTHCEKSLRAMETRSQNGKETLQHQKFGFFWCRCFPRNVRSEMLGKIRKEIETDARFVMLCCFLYGHGALTANEQNNLTIVSIEWNAHTAHCLLLHRVEVHYLDGLSATLFGMACSDKVSVPACMRRAAFTSEKSQSHIYEPLIAVSTAKSCNNCQLNVKHLIFA